MPNRITVRVVLENGNNWITPINTDFDGACDYFFGAGYFEQPDGTNAWVRSVVQFDDLGGVMQSVTVFLHSDK